MSEASCCLATVPFPAVTSAVPVVVPTPEPDNKIENLEATAQALNSEISRSQKSLAAAYWKLGDALARLRPLYPHGTWEKQLARLGINQTRAVMVLWFRDNFPTPAKAEKVKWPAKAFATRQRKQKQKKKKKAAGGDRVQPSIRREMKIAGDSMPVRDGKPEVVATPEVQRQEVAIATQPEEQEATAASTQPEEVTEGEFLAFSTFVKECDGLDRAMRIFAACCSLYKGVAVNE